MFRIEYNFTMVKSVHLFSYKHVDHPTNCADTSSIQTPIVSKFAQLPLKESHLLMSTDISDTWSFTGQRQQFVNTYQVLPENIDG